MDGKRVGAKDGPVGLVVGALVGIVGLAVGVVGLAVGIAVGAFEGLRLGAGDVD